MYYEVTVLARPGESFNHKYQIEAGDWRHAWLTALQSTGASPILKDVAVTFHDRTVIIGDPNSRLTTHVRPLSADELRRSGIVQTPQPPPAEAPARTSESGRSVRFRDRQSGAFRQIGAAEIHAAREAQSDTGRGRVLVEADTPVAPTDEAGEAPSTQVAELSSTALEDVFLEIPRMFDDQMEVPDAIDFVLDLAHRHVPSEHALLMFTSGPEDGDELHLYAAAARGPASETLLSARFSLEAGIPAASLQAGITLSIGNPARDARHNDELRRAGVREERCLLVAPIQYQDRAFGVLVLLNREGSPVFTEGDSNVIAYIGKEMGRFIQQVVIDPAP